MSFKKQLGCIFKAKDILINVLSDTPDRDTKDTTKGDSGFGLGDLTDKVEKVIEIGGHISDGNIEELLRSFDYIDTVENLSHCKVITKMTLNQNCLNIYEDFIIVIRKSFNNLRGFTSIEDLIAPWTVFSNTIMHKIETNCFSGEVDAGLKNELLENGSSEFERLVDLAKMSPGQLADKASSYYEGAVDLTETVKEKFANGAKSLKGKLPNSYVNINLSETGEHVAKRAREFAETASVKMGEAKDQLQEMAGNASVKMGQAKEGLQEMAENASVKMGQAKVGLQGIAETASIKMGQAKETLSESLGTVYTQSGEAFNSAKESVLIGKDQFLEKFNSAMEAGQVGISGAREQASKMAEGGKVFYNDFSISMTQNLKNIGDMAKETFGSKLSSITQSAMQLINIKWKDESSAA